MRENDIDFQSNELGCELGEAFAASLRPAIFDREIAAVDPAEIAHSLHEGGGPLALRRRAARSEQSDGRHLRLLRARRKWPRGRSAADQRYELAALHSITSSARATSCRGTSIPSASAVLRLMISSTLVTCWTGNSPGFSPLRIRPAYWPERRCDSVKFPPPAS